jgi:hypothetical protein
VNGSGKNLPNLNEANHITMCGFGDETGDWVVTLCGLTISEDRYALERSSSSLAPGCKLCVERFEHQAARANVR